MADFVDDGADAVDGFHGPVGVGLDRGDLVANFLGRFRGLFGEFLHLVGHDGKALARFTRARRLDGRVQGEQVGLLRDGADDFDHLANFRA